jgi:CIC family chloride channel protein
MVSFPGLSRLTSLIERFRRTEFIYGTALGAIVGITTGIGAFLFRRLIEYIQTGFFEEGAHALSFMGNYYVVILPAVGGAIVGAIIYFSRTSESKGHGVPDVMEAVATKGGRIRERVAGIEILASAICIGSGGSTGREGPIVQIGSSLGSTLGQRLRLPEEWIKTLVACGAAGGISATFNAPIAGVFFAHEVILGRVLTRHFGFVVISSIVAAVIAHALLGDKQTFMVPAYSLVNNWELLLYLLLGILAAAVATAFIRSLYKLEDVFEGFKFPEYLKPALGGLAVGIMGLYSPYIFGVGYEGVEQALLGNIGLLALIALLLFKILATSFTLGSGGSGGIFAPSLFMGAMLGGAFGEIAHGLWPSVVAPSGAYALVGMAAVFAGAARAPITAIIILFEMTRAYSIILPLMLAVVVSTLLAYGMSHDGIYTIKLKRKGIAIEQKEDIRLLEGVTVREVMTRNFPTVSPEMPIIDLLSLFTKSHHHGFPVVTKDNRLRGIVTIGDLETRIERKDKERLKVADIATTNLITAYPEDSLHSVMQRLGDSEAGRIPVVDSRDPSRFLGVLRRSDIIKAYAKALTKLSGG